MAGAGGNDPVRWIHQVAQGDREAFGRVYDRYAPLAFALAVRILGSRAEAEDLLQEVFLQVWRQAGTYSPVRGSPEAWIVTMTRSRAIDRLRSMRRRDRSLLAMQALPEGGPGGEVGTAGEAADARLTVRGALASLPEAQRTVLDLAYFGGLTQSEIAARLGQPLGTVKTRLRAALQRLRELLETNAAGGRP